MKNITTDGLAPNACYIDDDGLIMIEIHGSYTLEADAPVEAAIQQAVDVLKAQGKPRRFLADLRDMTGIDNSGMKSAFKGSKNDGLDRLAYVGTDDAAFKNIIELVVKILDKNRIRYFEDIESARKWLLLPIPADGTINIQKK